MEMSGFVALIAAMVVGRIISERGYRELDSDAKVRLMDGFSKTRSYSLIPLLVLIAAFWYLATKTSVDKGMLSFAYFGLLIFYVVVRSIMNQAKLTQLKMPADYRRMFTISQVVILLGVAWFFFAMFNAI